MNVGLGALFGGGLSPKSPPVVTGLCWTMPLVLVMLDFVYPEKSQV